MEKAGLFGTQAGNVYQVCAERFNISCTVDRAQKGAHRSQRPKARATEIEISRRGTGVDRKHAADIVPQIVQGLLHCCLAMTEEACATYHIFRPTISSGIDMLA